MFSIVVSAPLGLDSCPWLDGFGNGPGGQTAELIVVDPTTPFNDRSHSGLRHVAASDPGIETLIAAGLRAARADWVIVTEDHCRPLPGLLAAYEAAIADHPEADLFGGAAVNETSTSPWSEALFFFGLGGQWAGRLSPITEPSNANLMVRKSALLPDEMALPGGLLKLAARRLIAAGRFAPCPMAVVDHILPFTAGEAIVFQYHCARGGQETGLELRDQMSRQPAKPLATQLRTALRMALVTPMHTASRVSGSLPARIALALRLTVLGWTAIGAVVWARSMRLLGRAPRPAHAHAMLGR